MTDARDRGKGPFTVGKPTEVHSNGEDYPVVEVLDSSGSVFAMVWAQDCCSNDVPAAKARATRIAESLNRTEGHSS